MIAERNSNMGSFIFFNLTILNDNPNLLNESNHADVGKYELKWNLAQIKFTYTL